MVETSVATKGHTPEDPRRASGPGEIEAEEYRRLRDVTAQDLLDEAVATIRRRISAASPDACAHIDAIREALSGIGHTPATIETTLRRLATGEHGGWLALERVGRGRYRLR